MSEEIVLVGGPLDGLQLAVREGEHYLDFKQAVMEPPKFLAAGDPGWPALATRTQTVTYRRPLREESPMYWRWHYLRTTED